MYDVDGNGWIDLPEMTKIVRSIYRMTGPKGGESYETPEVRAASIFKRMDVNSDGKVRSFSYLTFVFFTQPHIEANKVYTWKCKKMRQKLTRNKIVSKFYTVCVNFYNVCKLLHCV